MEDVKDVLITKPTKDTSPRVLRVAKADGNVPTSEEYDRLVESFNLLVVQLRDKGVIK